MHTQACLQYLCFVAGPPTQQTGDDGTAHCLRHLATTTTTGEGQQPISFTAINCRRGCNYKLKMQPSLLCAPLYVLHIVEFVGERVVRADGNDLPVQLPIVNHRVHAQRLDLHAELTSFKAQSGEQAAMSSIDVTQYLPPASTCKAARRRIYEMKLRQRLLFELFSQLWWVHICSSRLLVVGNAPHQRLDAHGDTGAAALLKACTVQGPCLIHAAHVKRRAADLHYVDRVVVALQARNAA